MEVYPANHLERGRNTTIGLANLFVVYIVWSTTYLAIRLTVREGAGFTPFFMGASRLLAASFLLGAWVFIREGTLRVSRRDLGILALSGIVLWVGGNGMVNFAEQHTNSGYAALVVGSTPIFVCLMEALIDKKPPSLGLVIPILIGFAGLAVLVGPSLRTGKSADWVSALALCVGAVCWGAGSIYLSRFPTNASPLLLSFYQQLLGGFGYLLVGWLMGETLPHPNTQAWIAWGYLVIFGSLISYTSYLVAIRNLSVSVVMTYGYVNPLLALVTGWLVLNEPLNASAIGGMALILLGVAGVFREKYRTR